MKIFVPGRLCLFGEHSDWAGGYRRLNPYLEKGYALLVGTNQGIYAQVKPHPTDLIIRASSSNGVQKTLMPMKKQALLAEAEKGVFFDAYRQTMINFRNILKTQKRGLMQKLLTGSSASKLKKQQRS